MVLNLIMDSKNNVGAIVIIALIALFWYGRQRKKGRLKDEYMQALRGKDKQRALTAGRNYYASLRSDGRLTIYDEQALNNDINAMNT